MREREIIEQLAAEKRVEAIAERVCKRPAAAIVDLVQIVYLALLTMAPDKIIDLWEHGQINFFIVAILRNQFYSKKSPYWRQVREFSHKSVQLEDRL